MSGGRIKISSSGLKAENTIHMNGMNMRMEKMIRMMCRGIRRGRKRPTIVVGLFFPYSLLSISSAA